MSSDVVQKSFRDVLPSPEKMAIGSPWTGGSGAVNWVSGARRSTIGMILFNQECAQTSGHLRLHFERKSVSKSVFSVWKKL